MTTNPINKSLNPFLWAHGELGVAEIFGRSANPRIVWYDSFTLLKATSDEVPWCSAFMCAAAETNGFPSTRSAAAQSWATYGEIGDGRVGDIVVFSRPGGHHVAFINRPYVKGDTTINCLGGNQRDSVEIAEFLAKNLISIRRFPGS